MSQDSRERSDPKPDSSRRKEQINWPKGNSPEWSKLDEDMAALLKTMIAPAHIRAKNYPNIIHTMCKERRRVSQNQGLQRGR